MADQVTVVVKIRARPGAEQQVRDQLHSLLAPTRAEEGCINFDMHEAEEETGLFLFHENWVSDDHLQRHFEMPYLKRWLEVSGDLLAEPMELSRWRYVT